MIEFFGKIANYFPAIEIAAKGTERNIRMLDRAIDHRRYMGMAISLGSLAAVAVVMIELIEGQQTIALPLAFLAFGITIGFFILLPEIELNKKNSEMEVEMPFFLRTFGNLLEINLPFERAMEISSEGNGEVNRRMHNVLKETKNGMTMNRALSGFFNSVKSVELKKAISQISMAYEIGSTGKELKKAAEELRLIQSHKMKEYGSKNAIFGLMFILSAAILPTFFLIYSIIGQGNFTAIQIAGVLLVVFPLISFAILLFGRAIMPISIFANNRFEYLMIAPGGIMVIGTLTFPQMQLVFIGTGIASAIGFAYSNYKRENRIENIENNLANALFSAGGLPKGMKLERIFEMIENGAYGVLSEESGKSKKQLMMNVKPERVLDDLASRNNSGMLTRVCIMMKQMIFTNSLDQLNSLAEDVLLYTQNLRERGELFAMQKYTLIFGAFLIPLIMKMSLGLLKSIGDALGAGISEKIGFTSGIVPTYLIIYAILGSMQIAEGDGKKSDAAIYFLIIGGVALFTFYFINF
ncbi:type II secretion system F family protein [Candidatus Micrarchaeota archaeon]|nr:type II secretion system F family protein [Candidatus Micrarchaeota archaeon]